MPNTELLTCHEVMRLTGIRSRTTIWRRIRRGAFPHPIDIGGGRIRWRSTDIEEWIEALPVPLASAAAAAPPATAARAAVLRHGLAHTRLLD